MLRLAFILCIIAVVSAQGFWGKSHNYNALEPEDEDGGVSVTKEENSNICHTADCYQVASDIWQNMNQSINPCEDFYEYACGGYATANPIPDTELRWGTLPKLRSNIKLRVLGLVNNRINSTDILPVKQVKKFFRSCLNYWFLGIRGLKHIKGFLAQSGGWPLIMERNEWNPKKTTWQEINRFYTRLMFYSPLYRVRVTKDDRESNTSLDESESRNKLISIFPPTLPLKSMAIYTGKIFNEKLINMYNDSSYKNYTLRIARMLAYSRSAELNEEHLQNDVQDMIELEKKFLKLQMVEESNSTSQPQYVTIDELQEIYDKGVTTPEKSKINWKKIMTEHFNEANVDLDGQETFVIRNPNHLELLADILENTDPRTIVNYMQWHFVLRMMPYTTLRMQALRIWLFRDMDGIVNAKPRWQNCLRSIRMPHAIAYMYVQKYFKEEMRSGVEQVFSNIQKEMTKHISNADWLSEETKNVELEKINKMTINVGFPKWINNETLLTDMYQGVVIGNQYMENVVSIKKFNAKRRLQSLKAPPNEDDWYSYPLLVNAFYNRKKNALTIPVGNLQSPVYSVLQPNSVNYGELGMIISHEVAHGFDNYGFGYDQDGKKTDWSEEVTKSYNERSQCYSKQYEDFYSIETSLENPTNKKTVETLLSENLSDSLGMDIIVGALQEVEKEKTSLLLPGLETWSSGKIFFHSFAKLWCNNRRPDFHKVIHRRKVHGIPKYRVNIPLQNSEHFAKVFNCPKDSPMNPSSKCKLW